MRLQMKHKEEGCVLCPRECGVFRREGQKGACRTSGEGILAARAALHFWEEPCISGTCGSGAVFFSGCPLGCIYCQNQEISRGGSGIRVSVEELSEIFLRLSDQGAANINLVTPTHYTPEIIRAVGKARKKGLGLPVVYNCSGYEKRETLESLKGTVDIYLTDFKYMEEETARNYSRAADYPDAAKEALAEMVRQQGEPLFLPDGRMERGVIVRHLLLPGLARHGGKAVPRPVREYIHDIDADGLYRAAHQEKISQLQGGLCGPLRGQKAGGHPGKYPLGRGLCADL